MLTILKVEDGKIWLKGIRASAASGDVLLGKPEDYTDQEIIYWCNDNLNAPEDAEDYSSYVVIR